MWKQTASGFTLLELSIVLVIIGLLAGGVLVGRDLIRVAQVRAMQSDYEAITTAVNTFKAKYNCLPGDCINATEFFGTGAGCPDLRVWGDAIGSGNSWPNTTPQTATCNGDGDGLIDALGTTYESFSFWQHLANAGLIPGIYSGGTPYAEFGWMFGINVPPVRGWQTLYWLSMNGDNAALFNGELTPYSIALVPGALGNVLVALDKTTFFTFRSDEMLSFDSKFDDGNPVTGKIRVTGFGGLAPATPGCVGITEAYVPVADPTYVGQPECIPMYVNAW